MKKKGIEPCPRYTTPKIASFEAILANMGKNLGSAKPKYKPATLSIEAGLWRIVWYNTHPTSGLLTRIRKTANLNRIKDLNDRRKLANDMIEGINKLLEMGWNGFTNAYDAWASDIAKPELPAPPEKAEMTIEAALTLALKDRGLGMAKRTADTYRSYTNALTAYLSDIGAGDIPATAFTPDHFRDYQFHKHDLGHGNGNLNDHLSYFKTTFELLRKRKIIPTNPLTDIDFLPEGESSLFKPLTPGEIDKIVPALIAYNPRLYLFTRFIAYEYIRPYHIARLKAGDINYGTNEITVCDITTKSKRFATKQLMGDLKASLMELKCHEIPGNHYLFGTRHFAPGPKINENLSIRAAEDWKAVVIDGLGINKQMYALKHTSAQYFVNNNQHVDVYYLRQQLEHSTAAETETYLQKNVKKKVKESEVNTLKY